MSKTFKQATGWFLALGLSTGCGADRSTTGPGGSLPPASQTQRLTSACDPYQRSPQVVLAARVGPYGGKQDLKLVRADGTTFTAHSFGEQRAELRSYIYIGNVEVTLRGEHLVASRGSDGAIVLDRSGNVELVAADADAADAFLRTQGVVVDAGDPPVSVEMGARPVVVVRKGGLVTRTLLPDYHGEPYVNVEAIRGDWALLSSYEADRSWRVDLRSGEVSPIEKAIPPGLQQFGFWPAGKPRLYFTLEDDGGFLASLRGPYSGGIYHSPDGTRGWTRIGSAARQVAAVFAGGRSGTYAIMGVTTGPEADWPEPPAGLGPVVSGAFVEIVRPAAGRSYSMPTDGIALSDDGLCAAYVDRPDNTGPKRLVVLNVESGIQALPDLRVDGDLSLQWIPIGGGSDESRLASERRR